MNVSDAGGASDAPPSDASDGPARMRSSLSSVWREVARPTPSVRHVRRYCVRHACELAIGGNGRVQMTSDTWLLCERRTLGSCVRRLALACPTPPILAVTASC